LLLYVDSVFSGVRASPHGGTEGQHIKALRAMGADIPEDDVELPAQLSYLHDMFYGLRFDRIPNDDGEFSLMAKSDLSYSDIHYNSLLTGLELEPWEVSAILSMNSIFNKHSS